MRIRDLVLAAAVSALLAGPALAAEPLVDAAWLRDNLKNPDVVVLDVRDDEKDSAALFAAGHIPGAIHSDYAKAGWRTKVNDVPGMLPPVASLEALVGGLGIGNDDHVVVVSHGKSSTDFGAAARVLWTLEVLGHENVSVLEGGHKGWADAGLPVETGPAAARDVALYAATPRLELVVGRDEVKAAVESGRVPLVDARPVAQFLGAEVPPAVGVAGTLPGAVSLEHPKLVVNGNDVIDRAALDALLAEVGLANEGEVIAFCNTGHWASVGWFLLNKVGGNDEARLYDGSMVEWVKTPGAPVVAGVVRAN